MSAVIGRDPFARFDFVRRTFKGTAEGCDWCGRHGRLYQYGVHHDAKPKPFFEERQVRSGGWIALKFCNKECHDAYHGV